MADYIATYTGLHMVPTDPKIGDFRIEDIAHALSLICRGNGHVKTFWSVGEHCIACAKEAAGRNLPDRIVMACLLHDAGECYLSDVPRPFKKTLSGYGETENALLSLIYQRFLGADLTEEEAAVVKQIDDDLLWFDLKELLGQPQEGEAPVLHFELSYAVRPFEEVEREYLEIYHRRRPAGNGAGRESEPGKALTLEVLSPVFSVCKVADYVGIDLAEPYCFTAASDEEKSLVCPVSSVPNNTTARDDNWRAFRIRGELDFSLIGILARISTILAAEHVGIFAVSTYNTDYIFTKEENFDRALDVLRAAGYRTVAL